MKAQFVHEALDFERGRDPKKTLRIGKIGVLDNIANEFGFEFGEIDDEHKESYISQSQNYEILGFWVHPEYDVEVIAFEDSDTGDLEAIWISYGDPIYMKLDSLLDPNEWKSNLEG